MGWVLPRAGVSVPDAVKKLDDLKHRLENAGSTSHRWDIRADQLVRWAESAERELRDMFSDSEVWQGIHSDRFWRIREMSDRTVRPGALIGDEIQAQVHRLDEMRDSLNRLSLQLAHADDCALLVPDTNIFIHYRLFKDVPWNSIASSKHARLVISMVVIDELDRLKEGVGIVGKRAKTAIKHLRSLIDDNDPASNVFPVRQGVTWQYLEEPLNYSRRANNDDEIVRQCATIEAVTGQVTLITADLGMEIRARVSGVSRVLMPSLYRHPNDDQDDKPGEGK